MNSKAVIRLRLNLIFLILFLVVGIAASCFGQNFPVRFLQTVKENHVLTQGEFRPDYECIFFQEKDTLNGVTYQTDFDNDKVVFETDGLNMKNMGDCNKRRVYRQDTHFDTSSIEWVVTELKKAGFTKAGSLYKKKYKGGVITCMVTKHYDRVSNEWFIYCNMEWSKG